ncbi:MAG: phosphoribosylformylglycinamidine synthase II, partial [Rhodobiaceae bacterium]|nr:phosphoribosylformylglycinamidine synthase II [Rhodobiaceae bacterium]
AEAIFTKWGLDFAVIGETTDTLRFLIQHGGKTVADLPIKELGDEAPEYDRPWIEPERPDVLDTIDVPPPNSMADALLQIIGSPDMCSRRWVWEQYDHLIQGNTLVRPGGDAAVVRVDGTDKALAVTVDVTPRYCEADPYEGGKQAVAEAWRNLCATGAKPLAVTDNLNFGNPERPEIMGQFVAAIRGVSEACKALDMPVVSGNVSLYNETNGRAILPTPAIGAVGLIEKSDRHTTIAFKHSGDAILMVGPAPKGHLGQSIYLREVLGREEGAPPPVDLEMERRMGACVAACIRRGQVDACHDISDGGLAVALAEMAMAGNRGAICHLEDTGLEPHAALFGEDQGRYVVTVPPARVDMLMADAKADGLTAIWLGTVGGQELTVEGVLSISVADLKAAHERWFPEFMGAAR